jgi:pre-60S factor REI1
MSTTLTCWTAPGTVFSDPNELASHQKTEWHRYNLKRKVAGLPAMSGVDFEKLRATLMDSVKEKPKVSKSDHKKKASKKQRKKTAAKARFLIAQGLGPQDNVEDEGEGGAAAAPPAPSSEDEVSAASEGSSEASYADFGLTEEGEPDVRYSLFDSHVSETIDENVAYMLETHSFFIPDSRYLVDLPGLISYCAEKVRIGNMCLYCDKIFPSGRACQQHMCDTGHCKLAYSTEEEQAEYGDYYDFSETWVSAPKLLGDGTGEAGDAILDVETERASRTSRIEILATGEMMVTRDDGSSSRIGIRQMRRYYKQHHRMDEERADVLANQRERMLCLYKKAGVTQKAAAHLIKTGQGRSLAARVGFGKGAVERQRRQQVWRNRNMAVRSLHIGMLHNLLQKHAVAGKNPIGCEGSGIHG